jgi:hypothetical protein
MRPKFLRAPIFSMNAVLQSDSVPFRSFMCVVCGFI